MYLAYMYHIFLIFPIFLPYIYYTFPIFVLGLRTARTFVETAQLGLAKLLPKDGPEMDVTPFRDAGVATGPSRSTPKSCDDGGI